MHRRKTPSSQSPLSTRKPLLRAWTRSRDLVVQHTYTEYGSIASPRDPRKTQFLFADKKEDSELSRLNDIYGIHLKDEIFEVKTLGSSLTLGEISEVAKKAGDSYIYIGGIAFPHRNILYIEYDDEKKHHCAALPIAPESIVISLIRHRLQSL